MAVRRTGDVPRAQTPTQELPGTTPQAAPSAPNPTLDSAPLPPRMPNPLVGPSTTGGAMRAPGSSATSRMLTAVNHGDQLGAHAAIRQIIAGAPHERRKAAADALDERLA